MQENLSAKEIHCPISAEIDLLSVYNTKPLNYESDPKIYLLNDLDYSRQQHYIQITINC